MAERDEFGNRAERIEAKVDALAESVEERFKQIDQRFEQIDQRFEKIDERFDQVTEAFVEQRQYTDFAFGRLDARLSSVERQISGQLIPAVGRIERKLDGFIEAQTTTNALVERRLQRLELAHGDDA